LNICHTVHIVKRRKNGDTKSRSLALLGRLDFLRGRFGASAFFVFKFTILRLSPQLLQFAARLTLYGRRLVAAEENQYARADSEQGGAGKTAQGAGGGGY